MITVRNPLTFQTQGKRPLQEDALLIDPYFRYFVLADGFGEKNAGAFAAKTACDAVMAFLSKNANDEEVTLPYFLRSYQMMAQNVLANAVAWANRVLLKEQKKAAVSLLAAMVDNNTFFFSAVGSVNAFLIRDGVMRPLFLPQTWGFFQKAQMSWSQDQLLDIFNTLPLVSVGMHFDLDPACVAIACQPHDVFFLTSDGLCQEIQQKIDHFFVQYESYDALFWESLGKMLASEQSHDNWVCLFLEVEKTKEKESFLRKSL
jgi:serine/threonine protein phosphatase PrpC